MTKVWPQNTTEINKNVTRETNLWPKRTGKKPILFSSLKFFLHKFTTFLANLLDNYLAIFTMLRIENFHNLHSHFLISGSAKNISKSVDNAAF
jgi:hypothetical protein